MEILSYFEDNLMRCAQKLQNGGLVAFPTETVYGLGANALDANACASIFTAKGRPFTDPLIVHVPTLQQAFPLLCLSADETALVTTLSERYWPGPLTLILRKSALVPDVVTGGGEFVGIRIPAHPLALELLLKSGIPVAAPSANRFGHVSPTCAQHVADDLSHVDVLVLDGGNCAVGIESTIVKVEGRHLTVLRRGIVGVEDLEGVLKSAGIEAQVTILQRTVKTESEQQEAPGQLLTHYAPQLPAYLLHISSEHSVQDDEFGEEFSKNSSFLIDFGAKCRNYSKDFCGYIDLSPEGDIEIAISKAFTVLRVAEQNSEALRILLPDLSNFKDEKYLALHDRLFRSASGKIATFKVDSGRVFV
jgi:L-threonylcarbamoyladenylate synthase